MVGLRGKWKWAGILAACGLVTAVVVVTFHRIRPITLQGAIIRQDTDTRKQSPIEDVDVSVENASKAIEAKSDFSGHFRLPLPRQIRPGQTITLQFRHPDYDPLDLKEVVGGKIYVVPMVPSNHGIFVQPQHPPIPVANVIVRYSIETTTEVNIGTGVKTFQVENKGNVPCRQQPPCSPDGKWKAGAAAASLDAGEGNVYRDARVSCIAGPCPFTKVIADHFSHGGRNIGVSVLAWSDTATFLLQAEVFQEQINDIVQESYPVIFGQSINFTLPPAAEGPSLQAELGGTPIVFPLGPAPILSWADCNVRVEKDKSKSYRCELRPGYHFP